MSAYIVRDDNLGNARGDDSHQVTGTLIDKYMEDGFYKFCVLKQGLNYVWIGNIPKEVGEIYEVGEEIGLLVDENNNYVFIASININFLAV